MAYTEIPAMHEYNLRGAFRFWCQKVLPAVYDDSLSYYELLCKVVDYLNTTMEDVTNLTDDVTVLHDYVENYFINLDVSQEIDDKLDRMATDGTLYDIIRQYTDPIIAGIEHTVQEYQEQSTIAIANQNEYLDTLTQRMDDFARLPDGSLSTAADAELVDIRVGYDGTNYSTAGAAVRGQIGPLAEMIDNFKPVLGQYYEHTFTAVGGVNSDVVLVAGNTYTIENVSEADSSYSCGLFITDHTYPQVILQGTVGSKVKFTPVNSGTLRIYNNSPTTRTLKIKVYGSFEEDIQTLDGQINILKVDDLSPTYFPSIYLHKMKGKTEGKNLGALPANPSENMFSPVVVNSSICDLSPIIPLRDSKGTLLIDLRGIFDNSYRAVAGRLYDINGEYVSEIKLNENFNGVPANAYYGIFALYRNTAICLWKIIPQMTAYLTPVEYHVGAGYEYTSVTSALIAIKDDDTPKKLYIHAGTYDIYDEMGGDNYFNNLPTLQPTDWKTYCNLIPENTEIIGVGKVTLQFNMADDDPNRLVFSTLNAINGVTIRNIDIEQNSGRYAIHMEGGTASTSNGDSYILENININCSIANPAIGIGMNTNTFVLLDNVNIKNDRGDSVYHHTNHHGKETIIIKNCIFNAGLNLQNWSGSAQGAKGVKTFIKNSYLAGLNIYSTDSSATISDYVVTLSNCNDVTVNSRYVTPDVTKYNSI